jgi:MFS family permease
MYKNLQFKMLSFCNGLVFFAPVSLLLRTSRGVSLSQFFLLQALLSVMVFVLEIPTGMVTDRIGYKKGILLSQIVLFLARAIFLVADHMVYFVIEAVLEAFASCFMSGTGEAYLYERCKETGDEDSFMEESAKVNAWGTAGFIISTVCYAGLYRLTGLNGLVIATEAAAFVGIVAVCFMPKESRFTTADCGEKETIATEAGRMQSGKEKTIAANSAASLKSLPPVLWKFMLIDSMVGLVGLIVNFLYAQKLEWSQIPVEWMTPIILAYSALDLLVPKVFGILRGKNDVPVYRIFATVGGLLLIGIFCSNNYAGVAFMMFTPFVLAVMGMIQYQYENCCIDRAGMEGNRATLLSVMNMGNNLFEILFLLLSAVIGSGQGNWLFLFAGILIFLLAFLGGNLIKAERRLS